MSLSTMVQKKAVYSSVSLENFPASPNRPIVMNLITKDTRERVRVSVRCLKCKPSTTAHYEVVMRILIVHSIS